MPGRRGSTVPPVKSAKMCPAPHVAQSEVKFLLLSPCSIVRHGMAVNQNSK
jgi:hypothetical protein